MNLDWSTACGGGAGRERFQGAKKRPSEGEELNALADNAVKEVLNTNKRKNSKESSEPGSEDKHEHFNFKTIKIGED